MMKKITSLILIAFAICWQTNAQVAVGTGTDTGAKLPISSCYGYSYTQQIYPQADINASAGDITSISFNLESSASTNDESTDWTVYIGQSSKTEFTSDSDWVAGSDLTQVYTGTVTYPEDGNYLEVIFDTPFSYNGTDNLIVAVDENQAGYDCTNNWFKTVTGNNNGIYYQSDSINPDPMSPQEATNTLTYYANAIFGGLTSPCPNVSNLESANVTSTTADLSWTENGSATEWEVIYGPIGFDPETEGNTIQDNDGDLGETLTDLTAGTQYQFYVRALCGDSEESVLTAPGNFSTICVPLSDFTEGFESTPVYEVPYCWETIIGSNNEFARAYVVGYNNDTQGENSFYFYDSGDAAAVLYLITPEITNLADADHRLRFFADSDTGITIDVGTITDPADNTTFTSVGIITPMDETDEYSVNFDESSTDNYIALKVTFESTFDAANIDDLKWEAIPSCLKPEDLTISGVTQTTADLAWTAGDAETEWEIVYGLSGFDPEIEGISETTSDSPNYGLTGLSPNTEYEVYVKAVCGTDDESIFSYPISFFTACETVTSFPYEEDFESPETPNLPNCWTQIDGNDDGDVWETYTTYGVEDSKAAGLHTDFNSGDNDDYLVSPQFALSGSEQLRFSVRSRTTGEPNDFKVVLSTTDTDAGSFTEELMALTTVSSTDYQEYTIDLSVYIGNVYISIYVPSGGLDGYYLYVDDFIIESILNCSAPANLITTNITSTTADLSWTENGTATEWEIIYGAPGFDPTVDTEATTVSDNDGTLGETLDGLTEMTEYEVYVRAICADGESELTGPVSFTTEATPCVVPTDITIENLTDTSADISWAENGDATEWEIVYGAPGFDPMTESEGTTVSDNDATLGETLSGLTPETEYEVYVRAICADGESELAGPESFTTEVAPCEVPTDITFANVNDTSADVSWTENGTASEWEIVYGELNFDPITEGTSVLDNDGTVGKSLTDLTPGQDYDVYVRALCGDDNESDFSEVAMITTLSIDSQRFEGFTYYPNPVQGELSLKATATIGQVRVYNLLGQLVISDKPQDVQAKLDLSSLQSGVYLMKVDLDGSEQVFRLIKK